MYSINLKDLSNSDGGSDKVVILRLYMSLVSSNLDYGSVVRGSTYYSYLKMLDSAEAALDERMSHNTSIHTNLKIYITKYICDL